MVILGGSAFLMGEVPLYTPNPKTRAGVCDAGGGGDDEQAAREG